MIFQDVFIIGATGKVGKKLIEQIYQKGDTDWRRHVHPTRIVGVASSTHYLFDPNGLSSDRSREFANRGGDAKKYGSLDELVRLPLERGNDSLVFVDVTAARDIAPFHLKVVEETPYAVITANKNPLTLTDYSTFQRLTRRPLKYDYRCSVMAGAEAVVFLRDLRDVEDRPQLIEGCFSGTLGYLCSQLGQRPFSEVLADAHQLGYTEPHPRDDLNGLDVARKLLILARTAGHSVGLSDIRVEPFIPEEFLAEDDIEAFLHSSKRLDAYFSERASAAAAAGKVLRYVARMEVRDGGAPTMTISLQEVPRNSQLGALQGTLNKIIVVSQTYPSTAPYSIEAPGAGLDVTAQNIRKGLLNIIWERQFRE